MDRCIRVIKFSFMEEWKSYKLVDFIEFNPTISLKKGTMARKITMDQLTPHSRDIYSWGYEPYYGGAKFQNGDTIMARITPCLENGKHAYISLLDEGETAYGSTEYIVMRGKPGISDNRFVYYLSHYPDFKNAAIKSMVGSSGRQRAQVDVLKNLEFYLPGLEEQKQIATTLSALDDKIALNNRINHNLEEQAQALYKSWFVDFEPFKGGKFVDSELGLIPEGCRVLPFSEFVQISNEKVCSELIPEYSVTNTGIIPRDAKFNKQLSSSSLNNKLIRKGDLVFGMSREILNWGIMNEEVGGVSSAYTVYVIDKQVINEDYLRLFIQHHPVYFKDLIKPAAREGQGIDKKVLASKRVYIPDKAIWIRFQEKVSSLFVAQRQLMNQAHSLTNLRDEILPILMGQPSTTEQLNC